MHGNVVVVGVVYRTYESQIQLIEYFTILRNQKAFEDFSYIIERERHFLDFDPPQPPPHLDLIYVVYISLIFVEEGEGGGGGPTSLSVPHFFRYAT